jgi:signal transduction histidine kinase
MTANARLIPATAASTLILVGASLGLAAWFRWRMRMLARRCRELETAREARTQLSDLQRHQTVAVVAADVAHDLIAPTKYFDDLLQQIARGEPIEAEDMTVGQEEVSRLRRLLATLRSIEFCGATPASTRVRSAVERAFDAVVPDWRRDARVRVDVADDLVLRADGELLALALGCLIDNAARAEAFGVRARREAKAQIIDVWDAGSGLPAAVRDACFRPWSNARPGGRGFGLAVAARITRSFGWQVAFAREGGQTCLRLEIPRRDVVSDAKEMGE